MVDGLKVEKEESPQGQIFVYGVENGLTETYLYKSLVVPLLYSNLVRSVFSYMYYEF